MAKTTLILALFISITCQGQDTLKQYFNKNYQPVDKKSATFYSLLYKKNDGIWIKNYYLVSGKPYLELACKDKDCSIYHGIIKSYHENGALKSEGRYEDNLPVGEQIVYSSDGNKSYIDTYTKSGKYKDRKYIEEINNSPDYQEAKFPGGIKEMKLFISKNLKYPALAQRQNDSGKVLVGFHVSKDGSLEDIKILDSPHGSLNEESLRIISVMPKWIPATQKGQTVKSNLQTVPIVFVLE